MSPPRLLLGRKTFEVKRRGVLRAGRRIARANVIYGANFNSSSPESWPANAARPIPTDARTLIRGSTCSPFHFGRLRQPLRPQRSSKVHLCDFGQLVSSVLLDKLFGRSINGSRSASRQFYFKLFFQGTESRDEFIPR